MVILYKKFADPRKCYKGNQGSIRGKHWCTQEWGNLSIRTQNPEARQDESQASLKEPWFSIVLTLEPCKSFTKIKHKGKKSKGTTYQIKQDRTVEQTFYGGRTFQACSAELNSLSPCGGTALVGGRGPFQLGADVFIC